MSQLNSKRNENLLALLRNWASQISPQIKKINQGNLAILSNISLPPHPKVWLMTSNLNTHQLSNRKKCIGVFPTSGWVSVLGQEKRKSFTCDSNCSKEPDDGRKPFSPQNTQNVQMEERSFHIILTRVPEEGALPSLTSPSWSDRWASAARHCAATIGCPWTNPVPRPRTASCCRESAAGATKRSRCTRESPAGDKRETHRSLCFSGRT